MARAGDYEAKAKEAEQLAASVRHHAVKMAFEKIARDYRALAETARTSEPPLAAEPT